MEQSAYHVVFGDAVVDRERILALWQLCGFGGSSGENAARYDWFYLHNPQGRGRVYLLRASGSDELLGAVGVGVRTFRCGDSGGQVASGTLVDFVVHPRHRTLFPALLLQRTACDHEFIRCSFVYGLPMAKAVPVVARLAGATRFTSDTYVRVVRSANFIRKKAAWLPSPLASILGHCIDLLRGAHIRWALMSSPVRSRKLDRQFPDVDGCVRKIAAEENLTIGDRTTEILAWRTRPPDRSFDTMCFEDVITGETVGYVMYSVAREGLAVLDFVVPKDYKQARSIWLELCRRAAALNVAAVRVEFGGCERVTRQLRHAGFFHRGSRPGFVILREPTPAATARNFWFTRLDEDV